MLLQSDTNLLEISKSSYRFTLPKKTYQGKKLECKIPKHKLYTLLSLLPWIIKSIASTKRKIERVSLILKIAYFVCKHNGLSLWVVAYEKDELLTFLK